MTKNCIKKISNTNQLAYDKQMSSFSVHDCTIFSFLAIVSIKHKNIDIEIYPHVYKNDWDQP